MIARDARLERMPTYGVIGALLTFIGFAWVANSIALTSGAVTRVEQTVAAPVA